MWGKIHSAETCLLLITCSPGITSSIHVTFSKIPLPFWFLTTRKKTFTKTPSWKWRLEIPQGLRNKKPLFWPMKNKDYIHYILKKGQGFLSAMFISQEVMLYFTSNFEWNQPTKGVTTLHVATEVTGVYLLTICTRSCAGTTRKESSFCFPLPPIFSG